MNKGKDKNIELEIINLSKKFGCTKIWEICARIDKKKSGLLDKKK